MKLNFTYGNNNNTLQKYLFGQIFVISCFFERIKNVHLYKTLILFDKKSSGKVSLCVSISSETKMGLQF